MKPQTFFGPRAFFALTTALLAATGCPQCAPETVGEGVARLTIRNVGAIATLANADSACGFSSAAVLAAPEVEGEIGGLGTMTFTVDDCVIDAGRGMDVSEDCEGKKTTATGKVTVFATRTVQGILTGDSETPIIPASADSVRVAIHLAVFDNFEVRSSSSDSRLRMIEGAIEATVAPRLAVAADSGACAIPTPHTTFFNVRYEPSRVFVTTADQTFEADIETSDFSAQNGKGPKEENAISGTLTVFDTETDVTSDGILDPDYDAESFAESYACSAGLAQPESFECSDLTQPLADGAARLSIKMLGAVTSLIDANTTCGFASAAVQQQATATGDVGGDGSLVLSLDGCAIDVVQPIAVSTDCAGKQTLLQGTVTVVGTKTLSGRFTGNPLQPVVPDDDTPARFALSITMDDLHLTSSADENALLARSGTLDGVIEPRTALSAETSACSIATPHTSITATWEDADLLLTSASGSFALPVSMAALRASNGRTNDGENSLAGTMTVAGGVLNVPSDGLGLDPSYSTQAFDAAWQCNEVSDGLALPVSFQCAFKAPLAVGAAALSMRTLATVASLVDANPACGFSSAAVAASAAFTGGGVGDDGVTATLDLGAGCTITLPANTLVATDCAGNTTTVSGAVTVTGTKEVTGFFTGDPAEPIVPTSRDPARFTLSALFSDFSVVSSTSTSFLVAHGGTLSGTLSPRVALDPATGACSVATPNARFDDVAWQEGDVTIVSDGSAFDATLDDSDLAAVNGTLDGESNALTGSLTLDGVPFNALALPLDPGFSQAAIDASTACIASLAPNEAACSFRDVLGNAAARLLVKSAAVAASVIDGSTSCGFSDPAVLGTPVVTGTPGGPGALTFVAESDCSAAIPTDTIIAGDCLGNTTHASGAVTSGAATKTVTGFLTGNPSAPIFPVAATAASLSFSDLSMTAWSAYDALADGSVPARAIVTGVLQAALRPIAGISEGASAAASAATGGAISAVFSHKTPVAALSGISMTDGAMTIIVGAKTFRVTIDSADLDAFNGGWVGDGAVGAAQNVLAGSITVDGQDVALRPGLVEGYSQAVFDATYFDATNTCNADLLAPVPAL